MLQEAFDLSSTQILSLYALASYLATRPQLAVSETTATWSQNNVMFVNTVLYIHFGATLKATILIAMHYNGKKLFY